MGATIFSGSNLPNGLSIDPNTGAITGSIPTYWSYASTNVTIIVTNPYGTTSSTLIIKVAPALSNTSGTGNQDLPFDQASVISGEVDNYSATGLPPGLTISSTYGDISGVPTTTGTYNATVTAASSSGTSVASDVITIVPPPTVEIWGLGTITGTLGTSVTASAPNVWPMTAANTSSYQAITGTSYAISGSMGGLSINSSSGNISGTASSTGTFTPTLTVTENLTSGTSISGTAQLTVIILPREPLITSSATATGYIGVPFTYALQTLNNSATATSISGTTGFLGSISSSGSPSGGNSGIISATGTASGTYSIMMTATNSSLNTSSTGTLALNIVPDLIASGSDVAYGGSFYTYNFKTLNSTARSYGASGLPSWAQFANNGALGGTVSGTPTDATTSTYNIVLTATSATNVVSTGTLVLTVNPITATAYVGSAFSYPISANAGATDFSGTNLPSFLHLNTTTGVLSGTATAADLRTINYSVDYSGTIVPGSFLLTVLPNASDYQAGFQARVSPSSSYAVSSASIVNDASDPTQADDTIAVGNLLPVGRTTAAAMERGLLAFDLSSLPQNATITSATLVMVSGSVGAGVPMQVQVQQATASFVPATATWNNNSPFVGSPLGFLTINPSTTGTNTFHGTTAFTAAVQQAYNVSQKVYLDLVAPVAESGTAANYINFAVNATAAAQNPKLIVTYTLAMPNSAPVITSPLVTTGTVNTAFNYTITASNVPSSFSGSPLPSGLSLSSTNGIISGTATQVGSTHVLAGAVNTSGTGTTVLTFNVDSATAATTLTVVSGTNQIGVSGSFAPFPLVAHAGTASSGTLANTLVTFTAKSGGLLATGTVSPTLYPMLSVPTGTNGNASVYLMMPQITGTTSVTASAGVAQSIVFPETTVASQQGVTSGTIGLSNDVPVLSIISGENQSVSAGQILPAPFIVQAANHLGQPVASLPLSLLAVSGSVGISNSGTGPWTSALTLSTGANGQAAIYLRTGNGSLSNQVSCTAISSLGVKSTIYLTALAQSGSASAPTPGGSSAVSADQDPAPLIPPEVTVVESDLATDPTITLEKQNPGKVNINWDTSSWTSAEINQCDGFIIQERISGGDWKQIATVGASANTYTQSGLLADQNYEYSVISTRGNFQSPPSGPGVWSFPMVRVMDYQFATAWYNGPNNTLPPFSDWINYNIATQLGDGGQGPGVQILYPQYGPSRAISSIGYVYCEPVTNYSASPYLAGNGAIVAGYIPFTISGSESISTPTILSGKYKFYLSPASSSDSANWSELFYSSVMPNSSGVVAGTNPGSATSMTPRSVTGGPGETRDYEVDSGNGGAFVVLLSQGLTVTNGGGRASA